VGVRGAVDRAIQENVSLIIDGVHLIPDLLQLNALKQKAIVIHANLYISDSGVFKERYAARGQGAADRPSHRYVEHLDKILSIQNMILAQGDQVGVPSYENTDLDETVQSVCLQIMDHLRSNWKGGKADK
jgi:2-phosphoglycerate kinase